MIALRMTPLLLLALVLTPPASVHAATVYVANNGVDSTGCGAKAAPCRSITRGIAQAAPGDKIIVGPGIYGDLDGDGTIGEPGEEAGAPGCGCVLAINKGVKIESSHGAAQTVIDGRRVSVNTTVLVIAIGGEFGKPGKGFLVTQSGLGNRGIVVDADDFAIRGNQVVRIEEAGRSGIGIELVDSPASIVIEGNQVIGFISGIVTRGANKRVSKNAAVLNYHGITAFGAGAVTGNAAIAGEYGILLRTGPAEVSGNAALGNRYGISNTAFGGGPPVGAAFTGTVRQNNMFGNLSCGMVNLGITGLPAGQNFWGTATGPGPDPADDVCDSSGGTSVVAPFATKPLKVRPPIKP